MDVRFTDEQNLLRDSARDFLASHCPSAAVRAAADGDEGVVESLWRGVGALGWSGLTIAEELGGSGLGLVDLCVLLEETGAALLPGPLFSTLALATPCIAAVAAGELRSELLSRVAAGRMRLSLAQIEHGSGWAPEDVRTAAKPSAGGYLVNGEKRFVYDAMIADGMIVPAIGSDDHELVLLSIDPSAAGVTIERTAFVDPTRRVARVRLDNVRVDERDVLARSDLAAAALRRGHDAARVGLCAEMIGGARKVLELSVDYAKTREQFGSPIGRFQAIQHKCANMLVLLESARSATYYAAWAIDNEEPDAGASACMAKAYVSEAYSRIAGDGIQIHGGMGFTWEADLHLYYKRAKSDEAMLGSPVFLRELAARALIDGRD